MKEKIAFIGSHGTGKTTAAFKMAEDMKMKPEYGSRSIGIIAEMARECPFPINREADEEAQTWIFTKQLITEIEMSRKYDVLICDRSVLDMAVYARCLGMERLANRLIVFSEDHISTYTMFIFKTISSSNQFFINDGKRDMDPLFRKEVEDAYMDIISSLPKHIYRRVQFE